VYLDHRPDLTYLGECKLPGGRPGGRRGGGAEKSRFLRRPYLHKSAKFGCLRVSFVGRGFWILEAAEKEARNEVVFALPWGFPLLHLSFLPVLNRYFISSSDSYVEPHPETSPARRIRGVLGGGARVRHGPDPGPRGPRKR